MVKNFKKMRLTNWKTTDRYFPLVFLNFERIFSYRRYPEFWPLLTDFTSTDVDKNIKIKYKKRKGDRHGYRRIFTSESFLHF